MLLKLRYFILNKRILYIVIYFLILRVSGIKAQVEYEDDVSLWLEVHVEKKVNDKLDIYVDHKSRISNNISQYSLGYLDLGISYGVIKWIKIQAEYGYGKSLKKGYYYSNRHRVNLALLFRKKAGKWIGMYRSLLQVRMNDFYTSEGGTFPVYYLRNKLTLKYELNKRFTAYIAEELYLPFNQTRNKGLSRSRSTFGLQLNISKKSGIEGFFIYQHELNAFNRTNRDCIYGLAYSFEF